MQEINKDDLFDSRIRELKQKDLWRDPTLNSGRRQHLVTIDGHSFIDFSNNDALCLSQQPFAQAELTGCGSSRLVTGNMPAHLDVEKAFCEWTGFESALILPSGWQANVATLSALFGKDDLVYSDALNHASIVDGLRLSGCRKAVFDHLNIAELTRMIEKECPTGIVVESLYSVDGDMFPLKELLTLVRHRPILVVIDEAHALGVYGSRGQGLLEAPQEGVIKMVTCSKALGAQGGVVLCSQAQRDWLTNSMRGFIYSTGVSPLLAAAVKRNIGMARQKSCEARHLLELATQLTRELKLRGYNCLNDEGSHIVTVDFASHDEGRAVWERLKDAGIYAAWLRYPTVPKGRSRLRFSFTVCHTQEMVDQVLGCFEKSVSAKS